VVNYEFAWFPKIHQSHEDVSSSWHDLLGLLGFDHEQQHIIIQKIQIFICKIAHRAIVDIHRARQMKLLEDTWCSRTLSLDQHHLLD
jgi:hypothetical protein